MQYILHTSLLAHFSTSAITQIRLRDSWGRPLLESVLAAFAGLMGAPSGLSLENARLYLSRSTLDISNRPANRFGKQACTTAVREA
ncbi:unnamed protein product [Ectocarpus sp. CCAP 1310/34]|nr:unnamed protein product [Ectocarpus sp. CCAP 1310/34]